MKTNELSKNVAFGFRASITERRSGARVDHALLHSSVPLILRFHHLHRLVAFGFLLLIGVVVNSPAAIKSHSTESEKSHDHCEDENLISPCDT